MSRKANIGSTLDSLLEDERIREEVYAETVRKMASLQVRKAMARAHVNPKQMAERMDTSRTQVYRLIGDEPDSVTINTLAKAAYTLGHRLEITLVPARVAVQGAGISAARRKTGRRAPRKREPARA